MVKSVLPVFIFLGTQQANATGMADRTYNDKLDNYVQSQPPADAIKLFYGVGVSVILGYSAVQLWKIRNINKS